MCSETEVGQGVSEGRRQAHVGEFKANGPGSWTGWCRSTLCRRDVPHCLSLQREDRQVSLKSSINVLHIISHKLIIIIINGIKRSALQRCSVKAYSTVVVRSTKSQRVPNYTCYMSVVCCFWPGWQMFEGISLLFGIDAVMPRGCTRGLSRTRDSSFTLSGFDSGKAEGG